MQKRHFWTVLLAFVLVMIFGANFVYRAQAARRFVNSTTPTFFVHGWGSSYHAEQHMANAAKRAGVTKTIIWANVAKDGEVTFHGHLKRGARNPIIEVNLADNKQMSYKKDGEYVFKVVSAAKKKWGFTTMNLVGHSMGNLGIMYMLRDYPNSSQLPTLKKQVAIAGHFNGGIGFGYPKGSSIDKSGQPTVEEEHFTELKDLRQTYPTTARVLNLYGDLQDGSHSDSEIPVNSAKSLKYLVAKRAKSCQEKEFFGKNAQHSKLHSNRQVDRVLINFLWGK